jgi:hypothetical protein
MFTMDDIKQIVEPHNALLIARGRIQVLEAALLRLANEVDASMHLMEPLCRREFGNTNYQCIMDRVADAKKLLSTS